MTTCLRYESSMVGSYVSTKWFKQSCHEILASPNNSFQEAYLNGQSSFPDSTVAKDHKLVQCRLARHGHSRSLVKVARPCFERGRVRLEGHLWLKADGRVQLDTNLSASDYSQDERGTVRGTT